MPIKNGRSFIIFPPRWNDKGLARVFGVLAEVVGPSYVELVGTLDASPPS